MAVRGKNRLLLWFTYKTTTKIRKIYDCIPLYIVHSIVYVVTMRSRDRRLNEYNNMI